MRLVPGPDLLLPGAVQDYYSSVNRFGAWLIATWADEPWGRLLILVTTAVLCILILCLTLSLDAQSRPSLKDPKTEVKRPTNSPFWHRLLWKIRPPIDLMRVDGLTIDRSRKPHAAWLGPTGAGKTSAVAAVRCTGERVYLAATPDLSDPLIDAIARVGGFRWTAGVSTTPIDFLIGTPNEVAERLTEVFRSGGVGAWKRAAYLATAEVIRKIDAANEPRTFLLIGQKLKEATAKDRDLRMICDGWVSRFLSVAEKFGESAAPGGLDLSDLLNHGIPILIDNDAFEHPGLTEDVVALALAEAKRCASLCPDGFRLIFEEAGQLGDRIELAAPFFRAGRRRNIAVDVLTQAESDLTFKGSDALTSNIATRVYFGQELRTLQKAAADRLNLEPTDLDTASMRDFTAYISHGRIRRLVKFPKPPTARQNFYETPSTHLETEVPTNRRYVVEELVVTPRPAYPALPLPRVEVREVLSKISRPYGEMGCWLWLGATDAAGYSVQRWAYPDPERPKNNRPAHQVVWEIANGRWFPIGEWDHWRTCPRHCVSPYHGEPTSKRNNVQNMHRVRGHKINAAAD